MHVSDSLQAVADYGFEKDSEKNIGRKAFCSLWIHTRIMVVISIIISSISVCSSLERKRERERERERGGGGERRGECCVIEYI